MSNHNRWYCPSKCNGPVLDIPDQKGNYLNLCICKCHVDDMYAVPKVGSDGEVYVTWL